MYIPEDEQNIERFYTDIVDSIAFNTPISFLHKYSHIHDYTAIIDTQDKILKLLYSIVSQEFEKTTKIAEFLTAEAVNESVIPALAKIINNKLPDIRQALIRRQISRGSPCLLDNNWRIVNILSTNWSAFTSKILLQLSLLIESKNEMGSEVKEVRLQMNVHEVESFLTKLKQLKKSLKS